jgi:NEDD8-activating enzyme E1 regulatory subunit
MILYSLPISQDRLAQLETYGKQHQTPLVAVHSVGFYAYFQVSLPGAFPIVDTHPDDTATTDLRLLAPWPELTEFSREMTREIDTMDNHNHGHLPLVVILRHFLEQWKDTHDGKYPTSYADKTAFRTVVSEATRRDNPEGGEENFEEAVAAVMKHVVVPSLPSSLKEVFDYGYHEQVSFDQTVSSCVHADLISTSSNRGFGSLQRRSSNSTTSTGSYPSRVAYPT